MRLKSEVGFFASTPYPAPDYREGGTTIKVLPPELVLPFIPVAPVLPRFPVAPQASGPSAAFFACGARLACVSGVSLITRSARFTGVSARYMRHMRLVRASREAELKVSNFSQRLFLGMMALSIS